MTLYLGLMSGTSMDGIDAAIVDVETHQLIKGITRPYSQQVAAALRQLLQSEKHELSAIYQLNTLIGRDFAAVANQLIEEAKLPRDRIKAIGSHGQTIRHDAVQKVEGHLSEEFIPYTVQLGCAHTIAEMTKLPVVADFRTRDLVLGGQGAPLAPLYHQALFLNKDYPVAVVNIGGIANVSHLISEDQLNGFDVGPGNCLMDAWSLLHQKKPYDDAGKWAAQGQVIEPLLTLLLEDPFFNMPPPKSIGKEYFSLDWLTGFIDNDSHYQAVDVQKTLLHLTAHSIVHAVNQQNIAFKKLLVCGGGALNTHLLSVLSQLLPQLKVQSTLACDIDPNFIEAQMMAWLAYKMITKSALRLPSVTGASRNAILGVFYPAGIDK